MGMPTEEDNLSGYEFADVTKLGENFAGKNFYLIHGTADVIVHYQHSMMLAAALQKANLDFKFMVNNTSVCYYMND